MEDLGHFSCLLIVCDELEEFSRYSREEETHEWKEVKVRTSLECNSKLLEMGYTFDKNTRYEDFEGFFMNKTQAMYNHFEVYEEGLRELKIVCRDITKAEEVALIFEKKLAGNEVKIWRIIGDKREEMVDMLRKLMGYGNCIA